MCGAGGLEYADRQERVHGGTWASVELSLSNARLLSLYEGSTEAVLRLN
jgi:hypothetical protein